MNFKEEHIELFRRYLEGDLSPEEKESFEKRLSEDVNFKQELNNFQEFEATLRNTETIETYDRVGSWESKYQEPKKQAPIRKLWMIGASVAAIAAVMVLFWMPGTASNEELVTEYFEPYDNVVTVRGKKEDLDKALLAYNKNDFEKAFELLNQYPNDSIGMFYRAESLMALEKYDQAAEVYEEVIAIEGIFTEVATFHRALALIGSGKMKKAKAALKSIKNDSHYFDKAKDLLDRL